MSLIAKDCPAAPFEGLLIAQAPFSVSVNVVQEAIFRVQDVGQVPPGTPYVLTIRLCYITFLR